MANSKTSVIRSTKMHGKYYQATTADQVNQAFADIAAGSPAVGPVREKRP